jgi:hypothetical protein
VFCDPVSCALANPGQCTFLTTPAPVTSSCETGYTSVGSKCIKVMTEPANYLTAITSCISKGAKLASIESQDEQNAVFALTGTSGAWLGLTDFLDEGDFSWVDGADVGYTNWRDSQPNNGENNQHCVWIRGDGEWDDVTCKRMEAFVCQRDGMNKGPRERGRN